MSIQTRFNERAEITLEVQTVGLAQTRAQIQDLNLTLNQAITIAYSLFSMLRRAGLGEEYAEMVGKITRLIMLINMLKTAILALEASTPYGAAMAIIGGATSISMLMMEGLDLLQGVKGNMA